MKKTGIICLLIFLWIYSCEYDEDSVYINEIVPPEDDFKVEINLFNIKPNSTIFIYQYTEISFVIDTKGHDLLNQEITIDADVYIDDDNIIRLYPLNDNSVKKLVFDIELKTNTGSIADKLGLEKYVGRYEYNVKFVKLEEDFDINFRGGISDEGYLQLQWDEPVLDNATVQKYELTFFNYITWENETFIITDPKQISFIDESYVWGHRTYQLSVHYKNRDVDYKSWKESYFTPPYYGSEGLTKFSYQYIDHEWMNVSWEYTGYKCKYLLVDANDVKIPLEENQREAKIQRFRFPSDPQRFKLYILPFYFSYEEYEKCPFIAADYAWEDERYFDLKPPLAWNLEKEEYYFMHDGFFNIYSISNFKEKRSVFLRPFSYEYDRVIISVSSKTSQIAIHRHVYSFLQTNGIYIYDNDEFENPLVVEISNPWTENIFLGDNYRLFYIDGVRNSEDIYVYSALFVVDSNTGEVVTKRKTVQSGAKITVSSDGQYICEYYDDSFYIYRLENDILLPIYSYQNRQYAYQTCQFSHVHPDELILSGGNETIIFDVSGSKEKYKVNGQFVLQDPKTGNYACLDEHYTTNSHLNIYDNSFSRILTKIPFYYYYKEPHYFLNNRLIVYAPGLSAGLDISDYIR